MALEVGEDLRQPPRSVGQRTLQEESVWLREWLRHLEGWVESRMVASRALVALTVDGETKGGGVGLVREADGHEPT